MRGFEQHGGKHYPRLIIKEELADSAVLKFTVASINVTDDSVVLGLKK